MDTFYVALYEYSYSPAEGCEVSFKAGDVFILRDKSNSEWWLVSPITNDEIEFYVPANYIDLMGNAVTQGDSEDVVTPTYSKQEGEHLSIDSAIEGSCDSLSTDSDFSPVKQKQADSGADSTDSVSNLPMTSSDACQTSSPYLKLPLSTDPSGGMGMNGHRIILRPTTFLEDMRSESNDRNSRLSSNSQSDEAAQQRKNSIPQLDFDEVRAKPRSSSVAAPIPQPRKRSLFKDRLTSTLNAGHHKVRSQIDMGSEERSSFRKSLDDLITQEALENQSMMSSTFSIATTTNVMGGTAPSMDCLYSRQDDVTDDELDNDDVMLRSESLSSFAINPSNPYAFFPSQEMGSDQPTDAGKDVLREGVLWKKVEMENSKTLMNWSALKQQGKCFVQLTERALLFFKDKKHAQSKGSVAQSRPEHSFELFASNIEWRRGKKNTFQLWCDFLPGNKVLLKSPNPYDAVQWFDAINSVIVNLKTGVTKMETDFDHISAVTDSGTLNRSNLKKGSNFFSAQEKISYRSVKSSTSNWESQSSLGSMASTPTQSSTSGVRNCLAKFLMRRPPVDELKIKGILKSAPVFGCHLELRCQSENRLLPEFVSNAMREVERRGKDIEGIYRLCGNMAEIQKLRFEVDKDAGYNLRQVNDIHVITGALKMYFRELPESLFPSSSYQLMSDALSITKNDEDVVKTFKDLVQSFSKVHQAVIFHLFTHLTSIVDNQVWNKMDETNVAIVFGPNLVFPPDHISMAASVATTNSIMLFTLSNLDKIFPPEVTKELRLNGGEGDAPSPMTELYQQFGLPNGSSSRLSLYGHYSPSKDSPSTPGGPSR